MFSVYRELNNQTLDMWNLENKYETVIESDPIVLHVICKPYWMSITFIYHGNVIYEILKNTMVLSFCTFPKNMIFPWYFLFFALILSPSSTQTDWFIGCVLKPSVWISDSISEVYWVTIEDFWCLGRELTRFETVWLQFNLLQISDFTITW